MGSVKGKNVIIKEGCIIADNVILEDDVCIDYNCIIRENVIIKKGSYIGANCILGEYTSDFYKDRKPSNKSLIIDEKAIIRSGCILYTDSIIGKYFQTGHNVTIREKTKIGNHVSIGTLSDIQGECEIGDYVRLHSNVFVAKKSVIEDFVWIFPHSVLTNDPTPPSTIEKGVTLKKFASVAARSVILPGVTVENDSLVAAGAVVSKDVKKGEVVGGNPAKVITYTEKIKNRVTGEAVYPWRYSFERGMPWEGVGYKEWYKNICNNHDIQEYEE